MKTKCVSGLASLVVMFFICTAANAAASEKLLAGDKPPSALGVTLDGNEIDTTQFAGKVLVVTFWASWCGPCKRELPMLEGLQRVGGRDRIQVVAVNIEASEQFRKVAKALATLSLQITHDYRKKSSDTYGVKGIPHLVLIGRDGNVISVHHGYSEESFDTIIAEINAAIAKS